MEAYGKDDSLCGLVGDACGGFAVRHRVGSVVRTASWKHTSLFRGKGNTAMRSSRTTQLSESLYPPVPILPHETKTELGYISEVNDNVS